MKRKIAVVTTSRADYSHLYWVLHELRSRPEVDLRVLATAAPLAWEFGATVAEMEADGFTIDERIECLLSSDTDVGMAKTIGVATLGLADALGKMRPDMLLLIADRYELLAPAAVAVALRIPIAHVEGGEISRGAIDDAVRNAVTKLSHLHFTPTGAARDRVLAMGEEAWRVHRTGAPSLDHLTKRELLDGRALAAALGVALPPGFAVVAFHPLTLARDTLEEADAFFAALEGLSLPVAFCFPNADAGSRALVRRAGAYCAGRDNAALFVNLNPLVYWSLLSQARVMLGNSSSGIMETASLRLPTVNVGRRQQGRQRAANVIDAPAEPCAVLAAVEQALAEEFARSLVGLENPYGDGHAAERIADVLCGAPPAHVLLDKRPLPVGAGGFAQDGG